MNTNKKLALLLFGAAILGSAATLLATAGVKSITGGDIYVPSKSSNVVSADDQKVVTVGSAPAVGVDFTKAAESTINSVVSIKSYATTQQADMFDPWEFFFGPGSGSRRGNSQRDAEPQAKALGSGVIISADGYIVTNNHVIDGAEKLEVTFNDNRKFNATLVGGDANTDVALLKIQAKGLTPIPFGNSDNVKVGEWVLAVGNPFGLNSTVTAGIVSAKARGLNKGNMGLESFIQHDAAVNPGNSGGALVNTNGELIGINTMIYSQTGSYAGYSFAIPSSVVKKIVTDIQQYGSVQRAVLGIQFTELDADKAREEGITATTEGVYINKVNNGSSAKEAGLRVGDVIVKLNGHDIKSGAHMLEQMSKLRPGDKVNISYYRDNKLKTTSVTLKNDQGTTSMSSKSDFTSLGCAFLPLSDSEMEQYNVQSGVKVTGITDGKFKSAGIRNGYIIYKINGRPVNSQDDVEDIYNRIMRDKDGEKVMTVSGITATGKREYRAVDLSD